VVFKTKNPPYPELGGGGGGGGIELSFGDAAVGMGNTNPDQLSGQSTPVEEVDPNILTSDVDADAPSIPPKVNIAHAPVKPADKPKVNNKALFPNKGGSQGSSDKPGNEGKPTGNPNALFNGGGNGGPGTGGGTGGGNGNGKGPGDGDGVGPGKGNGTGGGINYNIIGRTGKALPKPCYNSSAQGKVVVDVGVDEDGNVISTKIGRGTTVTDQSLQKCALDAAKRSKFSSKADAPEQQFGTITYVFLKN
jgi:TonB family protein